MKELTKNERIALKKQQGMKSRHGRKLEKFSDSFNEMFFFFLNSYRKGLLNFGGALFEVIFDKNGDSARESFRKFDDGQYTGKALNGQTIMKIPSRQSNILYAVIVAKKSWGLHCKMWGEGVAEGNFQLDEIKEAFERAGVIIPDNFKKEMENAVAIQKRNNIINYFKNE